MAGAAEAACAPCGGAAGVTDPPDIDRLPALLDVSELAERIAVRVAEIVAERMPAPTSEEPWRLLTTAEVAAALGRSTKWVLNRKKDGTLPWVRLDSGRPGFKLEDVQAFADARRIAVNDAGEGRQEGESWPSG
jgi:predicted DNA-binding transcriptional regulator AlpA